MNTIKAIFSECKELECLDLSNFDTSNFASMAYMFNHCHKLKEIKGIDKFKTNKVTSMDTMFNNCTNLQYLDLASFDTSNVAEMSYMFHE